MKSPRAWMEEIATDADLVEGAKRALEFDRTMGRVGSVDVSAEDGMLTIRGVVYSEAQKWAVEHVVRRAVGKSRVTSRLKIDAPKQLSYPNEVIAEAAATVLRWTRGAPDGIEVSVLDGLATLEGTVSSDAERDVAADLVREIVGVRAVDNRIVIPPVDRYLDP